MNLSKSNKNFVSPIQQYLRDFNNTHEKTASQLAEIAKHKPVFEKRDTIQKQQKEDNIWEDF